MEQTPSQATTRRGGWWYDLAWLFLVNIVFTTAIEACYLIGKPNDLPVIIGWALPALFVSHAAFLNLLPALLSAPLVIGRMPGKWRYALAGTIWGLFHILLVFDVSIFRLFERHFDGMIWALLTTPGFFDSVRIGTATVIMVLAVWSGVMIASLFLAIWFVPFMRRTWRGCRPLFLLFGFLIAAFTWERATLVWLDVRGVVALQPVMDTLPYYQPIKATKFAARFGYQRPPRPLTILPGAGGILDLPKNPLGPIQGLRKPNIIIILVEGGRFDTLNDKIMPHLSALARDSWRLQRHFSSGNETRVGIFGLLYSVHGTYWTPTLAKQKSPPWLDLLQTCGYDMRILSSTDLNYPEFRQTAFVHCTNTIIDRVGGGRLWRDRKITDIFLAFLDERRADTGGQARPFFGFLFFDASHQPYDHPPEDAIFPSKIKPRDINYALLAMANKQNDDLRNLYFNSLHYTDRQIGRIVEGVKKAGEYDRTIFIVVGDHGEEFGEMGRFGHTSSFNRYQTQTLGVLRLPGESPQVVTDITSHIDFAPTVLAWMGVTNAPADYSNGRILPLPTSRTMVITSGWQKTAFVKDASITVFWQGRTEAFATDNDAPIPPGDPRRPTSLEILAGIEELRFFLKKTTSPGA